MAADIGFIVAVIGTATATAEDGTVRVLQAGDRIYADEVISTGADGGVEIEFTDSSVMALGRDSQTVLDGNAYNPEDVAAVDSDVAALQQALLDGVDPTQEGEATAAGAGAESGNEGSSSVTVEFLAPEIDVTNGFDTTGINTVFPELLEEEQSPDNAGGGPSASNDGIANLLGANNTVYEDFADYNSAASRGTGFVDSRSEFTSQATTGDLFSNDSFGSDGPGGLVSVTYTGASTGVTGGLVNGVATLEMADPAGGGPLWTLTVNPDGTYLFTINKPYNHDGQGEDIAQELFSYTIEDADGDTASATLTINIVDDVPSITKSTDTDIAYEFTVTNHPEASDAGYNSSYGYYLKDGNGNPTTGVVLWDNVKDADADTVTVTGYSPDEVGFFIIPDGDDQNSSLGDGENVTFKFLDSNGIEVDPTTGVGQWHVFDSNGIALVGTNANVLFDSAALNIDGEDHVVNNSLMGSQNWEDIPIPGRWTDHNDINMDVVWTKVTATGDDFDVTFGADGAAIVDSIDFTIEGLSAISGITSNNNSLMFEFRDTNNDGSDDRLVGYVTDQNNVTTDVLTIDGILDSGDYDIQLFGPIDTITNTAGIDAASIKAEVKVTDGDGDTALISLNFNLNIVDLPVPDVI